LRSPPSRRAATRSPAVATAMSTRWSRSAVRRQRGEPVQAPGSWFSAPAPARSTGWGLPSRGIRGRR
jgi:hypothetical protein